MEQKEFDIEEIRKAREEEMKQLSEKLEKGVEEFLSSDRYREYLGYMQKFHNYSFSNIILIAMQRPDATLVAGYDSWKRKGRHVKKGEKGIRIIAPVEITVKEKAEAEENLGGREDHSLPPGFCVRCLPDRGTAGTYDRCGGSGRPGRRL